MQLKAYSNQVIAFFSRKDVSFVCLVLAILFKITYTWYFNLLDNDKLSQAIAGKNLAEGHGLTIKLVHAANLSKEYYEPMVGWPPGYSLLVAGIYFIIRDLNATCFIIDIITIIFYFIVLVQLLKQIQLPPYIINLVLIFCGLQFTVYTSHSTPTDLLTLAFTLYSCSLTIDLFDNRNTANANIKLGLINIIPAWLRYMSIPTTFIIPAFLLWNGWFKKDKCLVRQGIYAGLIGVAGVATLLIFQNLYTGSATYVLPTQKGIFWSNLAHIHPAVFQSFINIDFYSVQLSSFSGRDYTFWTNTMVWINLFVLGFILFRFLYFGCRRNWVGTTNWDVFVMTTGLINLSILLLLCFLSLTTSGYYPPPMNFLFTYVSDPRYFVLMHITFLIIAGKWLFENRQNLFRGQIGLRLIFLLVLAIEILHGLSYLGKHFTFDRRNFQDRVVYNHMINFIKDTIQKNEKTKTNVVVSDVTNTYTHHGVLLGTKGLFARQELNFYAFHTERPTMLILVLAPHNMIYYRSWLQQEGVHQVAEYGRYKLFSYYIKPDLPLSN